VKTLPLILPPPEELPSNLSSSAKWLAGEGAGSWFVLESMSEGRFIIERFSPVGELECTGVFLSNAELNLSEEYSITYPSHCMKVTILQSDSAIRFKRLSS
jgi:hypothetical protein